MEGWQVRWGGSGEEADRVGPLGTGSQCIAFFYAEACGFILQVLGCILYICVYMYIPVKL